MTNEREIQREIEGDLQLAGRVLYLEGKSDPSILFALLGTAAPTDGVSEGVLVRGLADDRRGSGKTAVQVRVDVASRKGIRGVFGVVDGDGMSARDLRTRFDRPHAGPLYAWPTYSIENMLVRAGWPEAWGEAPDWKQILKELGPYVALNSLHREIGNALATIGLHRYNRPVFGEPRKVAKDVRRALEQEQHIIGARDVVADFDAALAKLNASVDASEDEGHALVNGKWLVDVIAAERAGLQPPICRDKYIHHIAHKGGLPEVRDLWLRLTGRG